jgi:hypothetical protein
LAGGDRARSTDWPCHLLTPDNLVIAERGTRWRCRQREAERAVAWRR